MVSSRKKKSWPREKERLDPYKIKPINLLQKELSNKAKNQWLKTKFKIVTLILILERAGGLHLSNSNNNSQPSLKANANAA